MSAEMSVIEEQVSTAQEFLEGMLRVHQNDGGIHKQRYKQLLQLGSSGRIEPFTPEEQAQITKLRERINPRVKACWANCQTAVLRSAGNGFEYNEGYFYTPEGGYGAPHAWLTLNGKLVELTMEEPASCFGIQIDREVVRRYLIDFKGFGPLIDDFELRWKYTRLLLQIEEPR